MKFYLTDSDSNFTARLKGVYLIPIAVGAFAVDSLTDLSYSVAREMIEGIKEPYEVDTGKLKKCVYQIWFWNY